MKQIASQAAQVRHTFEASSKKRHAAISSATAAAALHMANLNKRRKLEKTILSNDDGSIGVAPLPSLFSSNKGHYFHSAIATLTRPEPKKEVVDTTTSSTSDGIILQSQAGNIAVNPNDVIQGNGKTTQSLVGNKRYRVWIDLQSISFAKAFSQEDRIHIASSVVNTVKSSMPQGRFLSMDITSGLWHEMGHETAVNVTMRALMQCTSVPRTAVVISPAQQAANTIVSRAA